MNRLYCFLCGIMLFTINLNAQETREHLKYLGIPIAGSLESFASKLCSEKDYTDLNKDPKWEGFTSKTLTGYFWKFSDCTVYLKSMDSIGEISEVMVQKKFISTHINDIVDLTENFDMKYGNHIIAEDKSFIKTYQWNVEQGRIEINLLPTFDMFNIRYFDYTQTDEMRKQELLEKKKELDEL